MTLAKTRDWMEENQEMGWKMAECCFLVHWIVVVAAAVAKVELNNNIKIKKQQPVHAQDN